MIQLPKSLSQSIVEQNMRIRESRNNLQNSKRLNEMKSDQEEKKRQLHGLATATRTVREKKNDEVMIRKDKCSGETR